MRIFLDMDDVLACFVEGACHHFGFEPEEVYRETSVPGTYDVIGPISRAMGRDYPMTPKEFWDNIHSDEGFWYNLPAKPWLEELIALVADTTSHWYIATRPTMHWSCYAGKYRWMDRHLPLHSQRIIPIHNKSLLAADRDCVLIDDSADNVEKFIDAGGEGVLFPSYVNHRHPSRLDPLKLVRSDLEFIIQSRKETK